MATLELDSVTRTFGDTVAVEDLSLEVGDGELVVLLGPSGCGKSTVLRLVAGLEAPSSGRILVDGEDVTDRDPRRRNVAMVFQNYALYPHMTVRGNLEFPLRLAGMDASERRDRIARAAELLGLGGLLDRAPRQLSGGQAQRAAMGRAIVRDPELFLMDEPLSNLDAKLRVQVRGQIASLQQRLETTTLYVTHDQVEAMTLGHRVAVLRAGRLQQVAPPQELYDQPGNLFVARFLGSPPMNLFPLRLEERDRPTLRIAGQTLSVEASTAAARILSEDEIAAVVGLRPESLGWAGDGGRGDAELALEVTTVEALGHEQVVACHVDDMVDEDGETTSGLLQARLSLDHRPETGDRIRLRVDTTTLHLFDADGRRLGRA